MDLKKKKSVIAIIVLVAVVALGTIWHFKLVEKPEMPKSNIDIQSRMINDGTINLRNAEYTENQIKVGYEVKGFSLKDYHVSCKLYIEKKLISTSGSTGGGLIELDENHYYFTGNENISQTNLPDSVNLTVEISLIPNDFRQETLTTSFNLKLDKEIK